MTYISRNCIHRVGLLLLAGALLSACRSEEPVASAPALPDNGFDIKFAVAVGSSDTTRGVLEEAGTDEENIIDLDDFKILIFDENQVLFDVIYDDGHVYPVHSDLVAGPYLLDGKYYYFNVRLDKKHYNHDSKFAIVALANWNGIVSDPRLTRDFNNLEIGIDGIGKLTIDQLKSALFSLNPENGDSNVPCVSWTPGEGRWIPMFGSKYCTLQNYDSDLYDRTNPMSLGDVNLVRAFAKIEVINNDTAPEAPSIRCVSLENRNINGRLMQDFDFTSSTSHVSDISLPSAGEYTEKSLLFHQKDNKYVAYVPEFQLTGFDSRRKAIKITVGLADGLTDEKWLWLAPYDASGRPVTSGTFPDEWKDIRRNYIYRYVINSLGFDFKISCEAWRYGGKYHIDFQQ